MAEPTENDAGSVDPYRLLGVPRDAGEQQVAEAYRALAQIYHPDRYAEASPRVRQEALRRMQAVNVAYEQLARRAAKPAGGSGPAAPPRSPGRAATRQRSRPAPLASVLYVDGSRHYHDPAVAPLGLDLRANAVRTAAGARQCHKLDEELAGWFANQSRNASMTDKLMYAAWSDEQRALYTASVGCSEVLADSVETFAAPCSECRPG